MTDLLYFSTPGDPDKFPEMYSIHMDTAYIADGKLRGRILNEQTDEMKKAGLGYRRDDWGVRTMLWRGDFIAAESSRDPGFAAFFGLDKPKETLWRKILRSAGTLRRSVTSGARSALRYLGILPRTETP